MTGARPTHHNGEEEEEKKIFSEKLEEFLDALECLYLYDNISGRHLFRQQWPAAAHHIYPSDLLHIDEVGTQDKKFRAKLEHDADINRLNLIDDIETLIEEYEKEGVLNIEKTKAFINDLGKDLSACILHEEILEKLAPQPEEILKPANTQQHNEKPVQAPNLAIKRTIFEAEPASAFTLTYKKLLKKVMRNPDKNRLKQAFNKAC